MQASAAAEQFQTEKSLAQVHPYGNGNINDTFLVSIQKKPAKYILQRLNPAVFSAPQMVMSNLRLVSDHMRKQLQQETTPGNWQVGEVIACRSGENFFIDGDGYCWRMVRFIPRTQVCETITNNEQARQIGKGLGHFHGLLANLDVTSLHDTLPGFHITPNYLAEYDSLGDHHPLADQSCREVIESHRAAATVLEDAKTQGLLPIRVIHGDPKANNFLFDEISDQVVSLIDLDTVKPGLIQYDLGDCLRSCCNLAGEEPTHLAAVDFDLHRCQAIINGYLAESASFLTDNDFIFMYDAVRLITFELGLRFYSDYLAGNIYFKARDEEHNLRRALTQFRLLASIEAQEEEIRTIVGGSP